MSKYNIRKVDPDEYEEDILDMDAVCFPGCSFKSLHYCDWWVAFDDGVPVAYASSAPSTRWRNTTYLARSGVIPEHRGTGLQRRLILARERHARKHGAEWLISYTMYNPASVNNLIRSGFTLYLPQKPYVKHDEALYWRKRIV